MLALVCHFKKVMWGVVEMVVFMRILEKATFRNATNTTTPYLGL